MWTSPLFVYFVSGTPSIAETVCRAIPGVKAPWRRVSSPEKMLSHDRIAEPPENIVDEVVMNIDEEHGRGEEEEDVPGVECAEPLIERARYEVERQPPSGDHTGHDCRRLDLVVRGA